MSTERESGSTGPQGDGTPADARGAGEPTPTLAFGRLKSPEAAGAVEPAAPAPSAPVAPAASQVPAAPTAAAPAAEQPPAYLDAPPPVLPPAASAPAGPAPGAPAGYPYAAPAPAQAVAHDPYAAARDPYGAPQDPYGNPAPVQAAPAAGPAEHAAHSPFGAGQPLGGWGAAHAAAHGGGPGGPGVPGYPGEYPGGAPTGPRKKRGGLVALIAAVALVAGVAGGAVGVVVTDHNQPGSASANDHRSTTVQAGNNQKIERAADSVAGIAQKALPSTVTIKAQGNGESGTGTGFVFDTEGHILTNNHVVAPATNGGKLTVKFADGSSYSASVLGRAEGYDVAVVKLDNPPKGKLTPLPLGDSDKVQVGDTTIAIGAPYGLESTVTTGIVSAKDRPVASGDDTGAQASYMNALQTDASINPGNSGGPLLDSSGSVIGINSAIQSNTSGSGRAGSIGLGFAIPINQAGWVADTLIKTGTPVYAKLGILRNDDYKGDGAQIQTNSIQGQPPVTPGEAADRAGLKPGDVITKLGGSPIENGPALVSKIWTHKPGDTVDVEYTRNGQTATTKVTLDKRTGDQ